MKYLKMNLGILEPLLRHVFFHPNDRTEIDYLVKSDDIKKVSNKWLNQGQCIISHDIEVETVLSFGQTHEDFKNDEFTVIAELIFK